MPIYQRPNTGIPAKEYKVRPCLLRGRTIEHPNGVWCADVTCIPMARGFLHLVAIMDRASRKVLAWRLSNTMEAGPCVEAPEEALARFGPPSIMNTDQGSRFTSRAWTSCLQNAEVRISMDGKGRFLDDILVERLWRSLEYECVHLHAWSGGREAHVGIGQWITLYNQRRPHSALAGRTSHAAFHPNINQERTGQQIPAVAQDGARTVQPMGSTSVLSAYLLASGEFDSYNPPENW